MSANEMKKDDLSYLMERMPLNEIQRQTANGVKLEELAAAVRNMEARGEDPIAELPTSDVPSFYVDGKFQHDVMANYLIEHYHACLINGAVHIYEPETGLYVPGENAVFKRVAKLAPKCNSRQRKEVYAYIGIAPDVKKRELSPPRLIPFRSQVYDLETGEFIDYSPGMAFVSKFPYDYKPDAPRCEVIEDVISAIACGDGGVINLILETFGYCFYRENPYRGAVLLYGQSGQNGKSTLLNMLRQMIGAENTSALSPHDTENQFRVMAVYGKAANIGDDVPAVYIRDSSYMKKLITGEVILAENKGKDPISFKPFAKWFFACNSLPSWADKSGALFSRFLPIPLNADFSQQSGQQNTGLKDRIWTDAEMEYLVTLSMDGLKRLRARRGFAEPEAVTELRAEYERENNTVAAFLEEYPVAAGLPIPQVYEAYRQWILNNGFKNEMTSTRFTQEVRRLTGLVSKSQRHAFYGGGTGRCFAKS